MGDSPSHHQHIIGPGHAMESLTLKNLISLIYNGFSTMEQNGSNTGYGTRIRRWIQSGIQHTTLGNDEDEEVFVLTQPLIQHPYLRDGKVTLQMVVESCAQRHVNMFYVESQCAEMGFSPSQHQAYR